MVVFGWFSCIIKDPLPMLVLTFFQDHISLRPPPSISWLWTPLNERVVSENDCYLPSNGFENNCSKIRFKVQKYTVSSNRNCPYCNFASIHFLAIWQMTEVETLQFTKLISRKIYICRGTQWGNFRISLSFRFYVKSILENLELLRIPFFTLLGVLNSVI